ncbi:MAG: D-alanyl-D-alanine carboxypeptidase/D-alanyl-D-alanine-endopeptidase [Actinobacteria bacterium]|nr:D-alanyl-D-alanine carboxypeptidase/D-alanyl-D-alanine-endopeptidase [Actinomycetota bacterium]
MLIAALGTTLVGIAGGPAATATVPPLATAPQSTPDQLLAPVTAPNTTPPTSAGIAAALAGPLSAPGLGPATTVAVFDARTGQLIYDKSASKPVTPASTTKLLTAAAALTAYGADHRIKTTVVAGVSPNELVLVGGGDPLLRSARPNSKESSDASLAQLADRTAAAVLSAGGETPVGGTPFALTFDDGLFSGPMSSPTWPPTYVQEGIVSRITALIADGGFVGGINDDPSLATTKKFAELLKVRGVNVSGSPKRSSAPADASEIANVESLPMSAIVQQALEESDNTTADMLAHLAGAAVVNDGSFNGGARAVTEVLNGLGIDPSGLQLFDGSGLSRDNVIPARILGQVLNAMATNANDNLWAATYGMPVAGFTGSLDDRFVAPATQPGRGQVRAKTGTLTGVSTLAGLVTAADGDLLAFAFMAPTAPDLLAAEIAWDQAAAALAQCGCK